MQALLLEDKQQSNFRGSLISGVCIILSSSFPLVFHHILFDFLSFVMFYALVCVLL